MKIKVLVENTPYEEKFEYEHGLSLLIETGKRKILLDAGQSGKFIENAHKLGESLEDIDFAVLSHGHYDHADGFADFLGINNTAKIYLNRNAVGMQWHGERYIGICDEVKNSDRLIFTDDYKKLCDGVELFTCMGSKLERPVDSAGLESEYDGVKAPEKFIHEHYLVITENDRRIVLSSCSHKGVINIVKWLSPDVFIGGFHFKDIDVSGTHNAVLDDCAQYLMNTQTMFYTGHCTGVAQYEYLKKKMGDRLRYISSGMCFEI